MSEPKRVWTVLSMLEWGTSFFEGKGVPSPRMSIEWLTADVLGIKRLDLYLQFDRPLTGEELAKIRPMVKRRALHEPLQYISGSTDFMSCTIGVSRDVLIPRVETEQMVELLLEHYSGKKKEQLRLLDIGTGSGCIPVAVKKINPGWFCAGLDISAEALKVAGENADSNGCAVDFFEGDLFNLDLCGPAEEQEWDIIISNPPYIKESEKQEMEKEVLNYEPHLALFQEDLQRVYLEIIKFAASKKSALYLECNSSYAVDVKSIATQYFKSVRMLADHDGRDRFIVASNQPN